MRLHYGHARVSSSNLDMGISFYIFFAKPSLPHNAIHPVFRPKLELQPDVQSWADVLKSFCNSTDKQEIHK